MKTIMVNQNYEVAKKSFTDDATNPHSQEYKFLNRVNADVTFETDTSFETDYPSTNLLNTHLYKSCRVTADDSDPFWSASLKVKFNSIDSSAEEFNTIIVQLNKDNKEFMSFINSEANFAIQVDILNIIGDTNVASYVFRNTDEDTLVSTTLTTGKFKDGLCIVDKSMLTRQGVSNYDTSLHYVRVYMSSISTAFDYMDISNVCVNNEYEIEIDSAYKFNIKNLDKNTISKLTGVNFIEERSDSKIFKGNVKIMTSLEQSDFNAKIVEYNKSSPFWFIPYSNTAVDETSNYDYSMRNLIVASLYKIVYTNWGSDVYDVIDCKIDMVEYK